ncbi:protein-lysine methyltransferase METTL21D [Brachypodium distachyon]|nr:protein-lysine methyltransferase METTL21D [Brachypodium distachyon]|eukprot:XP_003561244.3 protein-lysine methyltransferase METTL21D [Brachypodium distachyon]
MDPAAAEETTTVLGAYAGPARPVETASGETMLLWSLGQPASHRPNAFVRHGAAAFALDACGRRVTLLQSPSSFMAASGVTGAVVWDSAVVLAKFLEHAAADTGALKGLRGGRALELGAGCGLVGIVAALLGARVVATDLHDRLRLLAKNIEQNLDSSSCWGGGSAQAAELVWGDEDPVLDDDGSHDFDFILGSDVVYSEEAVDPLVATLNGLAGDRTTILLAGELRNDVVLECFLEAAMEDFDIGSIQQEQWHPDFRTNRVAIFILVKKPKPQPQEESI